MFFLSFFGCFLDVFFDFVLMFFFWFFVCVFYVVFFFFCFSFGVVVCYCLFFFCLSGIVLFSPRVLSLSLPPSTVDKIQVIHVCPSPSKPEVNSPSSTFAPPLR